MTAWLARTMIKGMILVSPAWALRTLVYWSLHTMGFRGYDLKQLYKILTEAKKPWPISEQPNK